MYILGICDPIVKQIFFLCLTERWSFSGGRPLDSKVLVTLCMGCGFSDCEQDSYCQAQVDCAWLTDAVFPANFSFH